jgi:predicted small lipoprotein YifL
MSARMAFAALAVLAALAGCGKKSAPVAPGPADQIIYPHQYPNPVIQQD